MLLMTSAIPLSFLPNHTTSAFPHSASLCRYSPQVVSLLNTLITPAPQGAPLMAIGKSWVPSTSPQAYTPGVKILGKNKKPCELVPMASQGRLCQVTRQTCSCRWGGGHNPRCVNIWALTACMRKVLTILKPGSKPTHRGGGHRADGLTFRTVGDP